MNKRDLQNAEDGPMHSLEAEQACLGCALIDPSVIDRLQVRLFYDIRHQDLVMVFREMALAGKPVDTITLTEALKGKGTLDRVGGLSYIATLQDKTPSIYNFQYHLEILEEFALRRSQVAYFDSQSAKARDLSLTPMEIQDQAESELLSLRPRSATKRRSRGALIVEITNDMEAAALNPGQLRGITTGFRSLDEILGGLKPGQLVVVGGRPKQGKSTLMLQMAYEVANTKRATGYLSLEMDAKELILRLICARSGVESHIAQSGRMSKEQQDHLIEAASHVSRIPIHLDDGDLSTMDKISPVARQLLKDELVQLIVVDYLQLIQSRSRKASRYEGISEVSGALKQLARSLRIPVIVGSQFSRDVEREARKPRLSDLRDSGSIEQDADIVILLHQRTEEATMRGVPTELIVAANRGGREGVAELIFNKSLTRFEERGVV